MEINEIDEIIKFYCLRTLHAIILAFIIRNGLPFTDIQYNYGIIIKYCSFIKQYFNK